MTIEKLDQRIYRSELRMRRAQSAIWRQAWCGVLRRFIRERNARALVRLVRDPPLTRDANGGLRQLALGGVAATSGGHPTTSVVGREVA
jgi:hypothetical protein